MDRYISSVLITIQVAILAVTENRTGQALFLSLIEGFNKYLAQYSLRGMRKSSVVVYRCSQLPVLFKVAAFLGATGT